MVKCGKNLGNMRSPAFAHMVKSQSFFRWHLTTGANAGTRIKPDFFSHLTIWKFQVEGWSSAAVRGRTGQAGLLRSARAGGCTPGMPVRGRTGQAALSPSARAGSCAPGMPPFCVPQRRKGLSKANGADVYYPLDQARRSAAAPGREETAEALRRELLSGSTRRGMVKKKT